MLMLCPICAGEFQFQTLACPSCGCNLIPENLPDISTEMPPQQPAKPIQFVELCRPKLHPIAMLVKDTLEQHGIRVMVQGGNAISVLPQLAFGGELRVMVDQSQIDFAKEVYQAYFENNEGVDYIFDV
ncbi:MAG: hypothetical protein AB1757_14725 [Acidobacteriota bacterium]